MSRRSCSSSTSCTTRWQSSHSPTLPLWIEASSHSDWKSSRNSSAASVFDVYPGATIAPCDARLRDIAAPMPRVPPVTSATRPSSLRGPVPAARGAVSVLAISVLLPRCVQLPVRARLQPLRDIGPDLVPRPGAGHQADVPAGAVEVGDVLAADQVEQRARAGRRRDVVGTRGDDEQALLDVPQVDAPVADPHPP